MSDLFGRMRIANNKNMSGALTLPYVAHIDVHSNDWNASADRGVDKIRIDFLGYVYTVSFTMPPQQGPKVFQDIQKITGNLEFWLEYYNPEMGKRHVMQCYRSATKYSYDGQGHDLWTATPFEWIGVETIR